MDVQLGEPRRRTERLQAGLKGAVYLSAGHSIKPGPEVPHLPQEAVREGLVGTQSSLSLRRELDSIHFGDKFSQQTGEPRRLEMGEDWAYFGWAERTAEAEGTPGCPGAVREQGDPHAAWRPPLPCFSGKYWQREGSELRPVPSFRRRRAERRRLLRVQARGPGGWPGWAPSRAKVLATWAGGVTQCMCSSACLGACLPGGGWRGEQDGAGGSGAVRLHHCGRLPSPRTRCCAGSREAGINVQEIHEFITTH